MSMSPEERREKRKEYNKKWRKNNSEWRKVYDRKRRAGSPEAKIKALLYVAKSRAPQRGLEFDITIDDIEIVTHCPLLGVELGYSNSRTHNRNSASLDRIDSRLGYVKGNVWIISRRANTIKSDATSQELKTIADGIEKKMKEKSGG